MVSLQIVLGYSKADIEKIFRRHGFASSFSRGVKTFIADVTHESEIPECLKYFKPIHEGRKTSVRCEAEKVEALKELFKKDSGACHSISMLINNMIEAMTDGLLYDDIWRFYE